MEENPSISPHFTKGEFKCPCCGCGSISQELLYALEAVREHFNAPVTINSAFRCKPHNASVGGVGNSRHLYGEAADIVVRGVEPSEVADYCESLVRSHGGVGRYSTFTHIDVRGTKARWGK